VLCENVTDSSHRSCEKTRSLLSTEKVDRQRIPEERNRIRRESEVRICDYEIS